MSNHDVNFRWILGRRNFLKTAIASGIVLAAGGLVKFFNPSHKDSVLADSSTYPYNYGSDTSWGTLTYVYSPRTPLPQDYYIGRLGVGVVPDTTAQGAFEIEDAAKKTRSYFYNHGYWYLKGPFYYDAKNHGSPYDYGALQAQTAWNAVLWKTFAPYVKGITMFADVEEPEDQAPWLKHRDQIEDDGWTDHTRDQYGNPAPLPDNFSYPGYVDHQKNMDVLRGFIDQTRVYGYIPGVYTNTGYWQNWFEAGFDPGDFVTWLAGNACESCGPCNSACTDNDTKVGSQDSYNQFSNVRFGRNSMVIYQFYVINCKGKNNNGQCGDMDISLQNGFWSFTPMVVRDFLPLVMSDGSSGSFSSMQSLTNGYPAPNMSSSSTDSGEISPDPSTPSDSSSPYPAPQQ